LPTDYPAEQLKRSRASFGSRREGERHKGWDNGTNQEEKIADYCQA
jgi:hypothetical protein